MDEAIAETLPEWHDIRSLFTRWRRFMFESVEFWRDGGEFHTKAHCERVLLHALAIGMRLGLPAEDLDSLASCAVFHDSRRHDDGHDVGHGKRAAHYYRECCSPTGLGRHVVTVEPAEPKPASFHEGSRSAAKSLSRADYPSLSNGQRGNGESSDLRFDWRVACAIAFHDRDDSEGEFAIREEARRNAETKARTESTLLLYRVFKDADALDRWRLGPHELDPVFLRTDPARDLIDFARTLAWGF